MKFVQTICPTSYHLKGQPTYNGSNLDSLRRKQVYKLKTNSCIRVENYEGQCYTSLRLLRRRIFVYNSYSLKGNASIQLQYSLENPSTGARVS